MQCIGGAQVVGSQQLAGAMADRIQLHDFVPGYLELFEATLRGSQAAHVKGLLTLLAGEGEITSVAASAHTNITGSRRSQARHRGLCASAHTSGTMALESQNLTARCAPRAIHRGPPWAAPVDRRRAARGPSGSSRGGSVPFVPSLPTAEYRRAGRSPAVRSAQSPPPPPFHRRYARRHPCGPWSDNGRGCASLRKSWLV